MTHFCKIILDDDDVTMQVQTLVVACVTHGALKLSDIIDNISMEPLQISATERLKGKQHPELPKDEVRKEEARD